jgi:hypothetical protein
MQVLDVYLIKPTHYDDNGYPIQWWRSFVPSNSLACVAALVVDAEARKALGPETQIVCHAIDEVNSEVSTETILKRHRQPGARVLVMLIGVQTNQFPRAIDIARPLRAAGVPVCIGGFHVSGCIAMLGPDAGELDAARDLGLSLFAGEAEEGRIDAVLRDGMAGALQPLYNHLADLPALGGTPTPFLGPEILNGVVDRMSSFDLGRGCPFECSFCTIINVQGRKSRFRRPADPASRRGQDPDQADYPDRHRNPSDSALHREDGGGGGQQHLHRPGKHQPRQPRGRQQAAEPDRGVSRDVPGLEAARGHCHLRLHHRLPGRHPAVGPA